MSDRMVLEMAREIDRREHEGEIMDGLIERASERLAREFADTLRAGPRTLLDVPAWRGRFGMYPASTKPVGDYLCNETHDERFDELLSIVVEIAAGHPVPAERAQAWIDVAAREFADTYADDAARAEFDAGPDRDDGGEG